MRTHNPLQEPAPWQFNTATRFAFLIRRDGTRAVANGSHNVRITIEHDVTLKRVLTRVDAAAHVMRIDYEVQSVTRDGYIYLTLSPRQEDQDGTQATDTDGRA